jgi:phenylacetate-CoA ligase
LGKTIINNWTDIPIITKKDLQIPLTDLMSSGYTTRNTFKNNTSGSSGIPFVFAKDKLAHAKTWALNIDRYSRHGIEYGISLQARFYGIPLNGYKYYKEKLKDVIASRIRFPVFNLSDNVLSEFVIKFKKYKFEYINGYTSSLVLFANYLIERRIVLKDICPTLKVCFPTSEMCSLQDRNIIEKGFGIKVVNEYGCAEMDILAFEDEDFDWILSNENVFFEIVDEQDKILKPGESGRIILTSLYNRAFPLIRYDIGDIGSIGGIKKNNSILISLVGRTNEFAILSNNRKVPALTFYYITKSILQDEIFVKELVIKQLTKSLFHFEYVANIDLTETTIIKVKDAMNLYLEPGLNLTFERKDFIERSKSGKLQQFYNMIIE